MILADYVLVRLKGLLLLQQQGIIDVLVLLVHGSCSQGVGLERLMASNAAKWSGLRGAMITHADESSEHGIELRFHFQEVEEVLKGPHEFVVFDWVVLALGKCEKSREKDDCKTCVHYKYECV